MILLPPHDHLVIRTGGDVPLSADLYFLWCREDDDRVWCGITNSEAGDVWWEVTVHPCSNEGIALTALLYGVEMIFFQHGQNMPEDVRNAKRALATALSARVAGTPVATSPVRGIGHLFEFV